MTPKKKHESNFPEQAEKTSSSNYKIWETIHSDYAHELQEADNNALNQLDYISKYISSGFYFTLITQIFVLIVSVLGLVFGVMRAADTDIDGNARSLGYILIGLATIGLLVIIIRNPYQKFYKLFFNLARINIILLDYLRQVRQTDALFSKMLLTRDNPDYDLLSRNRNADLDAIQQTLDYVAQIIDDDSI